VCAARALLAGQWAIGFHSLAIGFHRLTPLFTARRSHTVLLGACRLCSRLRQGAVKPKVWKEQRLLIVQNRFTAMTLTKGYPLH